LAIRKLRQETLGGDEEFGLTVLEGKTAQLSEVMDALSTRSLFGGGKRRMVQVNDADKFVSEHRQRLEEYLAKPKPSGVLALVVTTWPGTTKLAKAVAARGLPIECKTPETRALGPWLRKWCERAHGKKLSAPAADLLIDMVGPELGLLDQELGKLSALAADEKQIGPELVGQAVAGGRAKSTWDMLDAAAAGKAAQALEQLDRILASGENAIGMLAQMSWSLRKLAAAAQLVVEAESAGRKITVRQALEQAGLKPFFISKAEGQLRQLGRPRAQRLLDWLLHADLDLKGDSPLPPRVVLEQLVVRLAHTAPARP